MNNMIITTHPSPDLDALASAALLNYALGGDLAEIRFDSDPTSEWHNPDQGLFTVDVGRGELDHHQDPDPRSSCAFLKVCDWLAEYGQEDDDDHQRIRLLGRAMRDQLGEVVLRQDSTGFPTSDRSQDIKAISLAGVINRAVRTALNDHDAWTHIYPLFIDLFSEQLAAWQASNLAGQIWQHPDVQIVTGHTGMIVGIEMERHVKAFSPLDYAREMAFAADSQIEIVVTSTKWIGPEGVTYSRWLSMRRESERMRAFNLTVPDIIADLRATEGLEDDMLAELDRWYIEQAFAGTGGLKFPQYAPGPRDFTQRMVQAVDDILARGASCNVA